MPYLTRQNGSPGAMDRTRESLFLLRVRCSVFFGLNRFLETDFTQLYRIKPPYPKRHEHGTRKNGIVDIWNPLNVHLRLITTPVRVSHSFDLCLRRRALPAQTTSATLSGTVTDPTDKVVPGADVTATNTDTAVVSKTKTNGDGIYLLPTLQYGHYSINVSKQGFKQIELKDVTLDVAAIVTRNFHLELGAASDTITVEGNGLNVNTSDASVSTVISREFVDEIPLNGRTLQNLLPIVPGVGYDTFNGGYTVNGTRAQEGTYWTVDGISGNITASISSGNNLPDTFGAALTSLGTTQSLISLDALQEFRVSTSSYGVEYGSAPGGQIQLQSRAGTNQFHGSAYDYLRNEDLDANDWFSNANGIARPPERQNDFGGTLGGPITIPHVYHGRDKAFFFFSFEDLNLLQPTVLVDQPVPTAALRQSAPATLQPFLNAMPLPNGAALGDGWAEWTTASSQPSFLRAWNIRGDYALGQNTKVFGRVNYSPSNDKSISDAYQSNYRINTVTATLGVTTTLGASAANDFRVNDSQQTLAETSGLLPANSGSNPAAATAALVPASQYAPPGSDYSTVFAFYDDDFEAGAFLQQSAENSTVHQWDIVDGLKWQVGRHQLKFGAEWNRHTSTQLPVAYSQYYEFDELSGIQTSTVDESTISTQPTAIDTVTTRASLYAGDTWKVNKRLSLDYGLRWELPFPTYYGGQYVPVFVNSLANPAIPTVSQTSRTQWAMTYRNFAPRLGIAYLLHDKGNFETVFRTGGGLFYSTETPFGVANIGNYPNLGENDFYGVPYPLAPAQLAAPSIGTVTAAGLAGAALIGTNPHLALPRVWEWNATIEQKLGKNQSLTVGYVGSAGRRLYFSPVTLPASKNVSSVTYTENGSASDYNSLQVKFERHVARGLQVLASYTWAHSIDNVSTNVFTDQPLWGNSDFDIRHTVSVGAVYNIPGARGNGFVKAMTSGWELSDNYHAHTGTPVINLFSSSTFVNGTLIYTLANIVPGVPVYLHGSRYPGGTALNRAAFAAPAKGQNGNVPRNTFRAQDFAQDDISLQRKFSLGEKAGALRLRLDAFNLTNHVNFADYFVRNLSKSPLFGQATSTAGLFNGGSNPLYNSGSARSLQISLRYEF